MKNASAPRNARHAASLGFDLHEGFETSKDNFVDASKMLRRGTMEINDGLGNWVKIPFTAEFTFGKPAAIRKSDGGGQ